MAIQFTHYEKVETPAPLTSIYKIYDQSNNEIPISNWTISGLENAYYYTKGTDDTTKKRIGGRIFYINNDIAESTSADKFYVYDTTNGLQSNLLWDTVTTIARGVTADTIGSGKTNSATCIAALGDTSGTIWYFIKNTMNANSVGGCNDWYIGSQLENDQLKNANLVDWFSPDHSIWTSVESLYLPADEAIRWSYLYSHGSRKYSPNGCFAMRSF